MAVNLRGCFNAARAALAPMKTQGSGRILFTSSITGPHVTSPGHGHYAASKAGINGFIRSAALEFSSYGINVNGVEPGNIMTEAIQLHRSAAFIKNMEDAIPLARLGSPRDVANAFLFLASDDASYVTGTTIVVDGDNFCLRVPTSGYCHPNRISGCIDACYSRREDALIAPSFGLPPILTGWASQNLDQFGKKPVQAGAFRRGKAANAVQKMRGPGHLNPGLSQQLFTAFGHLHIDRAFV